MIQWYLQKSKMFVLWIVILNGFDESTSIWTRMFVSVHLLETKCMRKPSAAGLEQLS